MGFFSKNQPVTGADAVRPVNEGAAAAIEQALGKFGQVMHAVDPNRGVSTAAGGPPVWSVGMVSVAGERPYTLMCTYGLSYTVSPEPMRSHVRYELSIAIPADEQASPWGDAFLRAQAFYILQQKAELKLNDCVPFRGQPITRLAFAPEFQAAQPETGLVGVLVAKDPVIPTMHTDAGEIEVRRLVGIEAMEIDRAVTWNPEQMIEMIKGIDPLLLTSPKRKTYIPQLAGKIQPLADKDGSTVEGVLLEMQWKQDGQTIRIDLPQGPGAWRATEALKNRIGHKRKLIAYSTVSAPITFLPGSPGMSVTETGLEISGEIAAPPISMLVDALAAGTPHVDIQLQAPPPARARHLFFQKVTDIVKKHELDGAKMTKELHKLVGEAQSVGAMKVAPEEADADRTELSAVQRTLRFARSTDQSAIEAILKALS
ncbi:MAG: suppressor of fused domain protein [Kofleriaceae bacterium]